MRVSLLGPRKVITSALLVVAVATIGAGCGSKASGTGDAPIGNRGDGAPWDIISSPDHYPNIATRCDPYQSGKRLYIVTHDRTDTQPIIVDDPACQK